MSPSGLLRWRSAAALVLLTGLAVLVTVAAGSRAETLGAWWPAPGLAAATLVVVRRRGDVRALALTAAALVAVVAVAGVLGGRGPVTALAFGLVDVAEAAIAVTLLRRLRVERLRRISDVGSLVLAVAVAAAVGSLGLGAILARSDGPGFVTAATVAGLAHAAGLLLLLPLVLLDRSRPQPHPWTALPHALLTGGLVVAAFGPYTGGLSALTLLVLPLPLMVWSAARYDVRAVTAELIWLAVLVSGTVVANPEGFGTGPEARLGTTQLAQVYLVTLVLLALPLALAMRERDEASRRTRDSERVFRRAFTQSGLPVLLCRWDGETLRVSTASDASAGLLGRRTDDLIGLDLDVLVSAPALWRELGEGHLADFAGWSGGIRLREAEQRQVEAYCSLLDVDGDRGLLSLHLVDLSEHLHLQERLHHEQSRSQAVMDTAASMIVITDVAGRVISINPETTRLTGFAAEELVGRPLWEVLVAPHERQTVADAVADILPIPRSGELTVTTASGAERTVVFTHAVHQGSPAEAPTYVFSGTDVTEARESAGMVAHLLRSVLSIAFVGTDPQGRVTLFSAGAERLFGLRADEARDQAFGDLLAPVPEEGEEHRPGVELPRLVGRGGAEGSPQTRDWLALAAGRTPVRVSMTCNPVRTESGTLQTYLFVARDVTETRRNQEIMANALRREREVVTRLQELDRAKDDFISTVSHELRTPMSSIIGSAEMLADGMVGELEEAQQQLVGVISRNGDRLLSLADDLLTLAAFDRGAPAGPGTTLDLREVVAESLGSVQPQCAGRELRWQVDLPAQRTPVVGEWSHLERAVTNLLTNAVKFTPDGGDVRVELARGPAEATVTVTDTGRGISEADLEHVFERFYRAPDVQEHAIQGSGLGLAIVRQIMERHDGRVTVASRIGEGTSVALTLPVRAGEDV